jgi:cytochrome c oxidase cbb3-type subunit 3
LVLIVSVVVLQVLRAMVKRQEAEKPVVAGEEVKQKSFWKRFLTKANDAVPVEREETVMLDHNYDGIRELDNHLPPWWKWLFYFTIAFSVVYLLAYHVFDAMPSSLQEYEQEIAEAEALKAERLANQPVSDIDENSVVFVEDAVAIANGKQIYDNNCAQCHRPDGGGSIGPNLTDTYWIHGGSIQDIFRTVKMGVPAKGMISWEPLLSPQQMQNVSSYVMTLQGTNPPNPKGPQGDVYRPDEGGEEETLVPDSVRTASVEN